MMHTLPLHRIALFAWAANIQLINSIWNLSKRFNKFKNFRPKTRYSQKFSIPKFNDWCSNYESISYYKNFDYFVHRAERDNYDWVVGKWKSTKSITEKLEIVERTINRITVKTSVNLEKFKNLRISRRRIDAIEKNAFQGFRSNEIRIDRTQIDKLSVASFAAISVNLSSWQACNLTLIESFWSSKGPKFRL